jgi:hypothetical protein
MPCFRDNSRFHTNSVFRTPIRTRRRREAIGGRHIFNLYSPKGGHGTKCDFKNMA